MAISAPQTHIDTFDLLQYPIAANEVFIAVAMFLWRKTVCYETPVLMLAAPSRQG